TSRAGRCSSLRRPLVRADVLLRQARGLLDALCGRLGVLGVVYPLEDRATRGGRERVEVALRARVPSERRGEVLRHLERVARVELLPPAARPRRLDRRYTRRA